MDHQMTISPSREARDLFGKMVAKCDSQHMHLPLAVTLELAIQRRKEGHEDYQSIKQLQEEGWVHQAEDGGWFLA